MSIYDIHYCRQDELTDLQLFIDKHWRKGHVLSYSQLLFDFQHKLEGKDYYSFAIARNLETSEIDAVFGYIESQKYDTTKTIPNIGWGAIWKVRDDIQNKEIGKLGLKLLKFIIKNSDIETFASLGISKTHKDLAMSLNFVVGVTNHYYMVNNSMTEFKVALNPVLTTQLETSSDLKVEVSDSVINSNISVNINPYKNISYFVNRYQNHPFFHYDFWNVYQGDKIVAIFVVRKINVLATIIYRIIDFMGDIPNGKSIYNSVQELMHQTNAEYIDCINSGLESTFFTNQGFQVAPEDDSTIIPEHLDPLEYIYVPLEYNYMDAEMNLIIFKGDGDQDRPNRV